MFSIVSIFFILEQKEFWSICNGFVQFSNEYTSSNYMKHLNINVSVISIISIFHFIQIESFSFYLNKIENGYKLNNRNFSVFKMVQNVYIHY